MMLCWFVQMKQFSPSVKCLKQLKNLGMMGLSNVILWFLHVHHHLVGVDQSPELGAAGHSHSGIRTFLGWAMAFIYMGGRLPQIFLNVRRGNFEVRDSNH